jgi:hypothetical protein
LKRKLGVFCVKCQQPVRAQWVSTFLKSSVRAGHKDFTYTDIQICRGRLVRTALDDLRGVCSQRKSVRAADSNAVARLLHNLFRIRPIRPHFIDHAAFDADNMHLPHSA